MQVLADQAKELFVSLGFKRAAVDGWKPEVLEAKVNKLGTLAEGKKVKDKALAKLLKDIVAAVEDDEDVTVQFGKAGKAGTKPPKGGKKAPPPEDDEDDDDTDDDIEEEEDEDMDDDEEDPDDDADDEDEVEEEDEEEEEEPAPKKSGKGKAAKGGKGKKAPPPEDDDDDDAEEDADEDDGDDEDLSAEDEDEDSDDDEDDSDDDDVDEEDSDDDADDEDEEDDDVPETKTKPKKTVGKTTGKKDSKKGGSNFKGAGGDGKPGVVKTIIECLENASQQNPVTKAEIHKVLVKRFKDRSPESMKTTINAQIPYHLGLKGLTVKSNDEGYWLAKGKAGANGKAGGKKKVKK